MIPADTARQPKLWNDNTLVKEQHAKAKWRRPLEDWTKTYTELRFNPVYSFCCINLCIQATRLYIKTPRLSFTIVARTSKDIPQVKGETLALTLVTLPVWILTFSSYIVMLFIKPSRRMITIDNFFNALYAVVYAAAAGTAVSSRDFVQVCVSDDGSVVDDQFCDKPLSLKLRNEGQNLALVILGLGVATIYFSHWILVTVRLCMSPVAFDEHTVDFQPVSAK